MGRVLYDYLNNNGLWIFFNKYDVFYYCGFGIGIYNVFLDFNKIWRYIRV